MTNFKTNLPRPTDRGDRSHEPTNDPAPKQKIQASASGHSSTASGAQLSELQKLNIEHIARHQSKDKDKFPAELRPEDFANESHEPSTELVTKDDRRTSLDTGQKVTIPSKILPKADIAPGVQLSPMQRLHIEHITRHPPAKKPPKGKPVLF